MRLFVGGSNGLILYEDGDITSLTSEEVICAVRPAPGKVVAGAHDGKIVFWEGNGAARVVVKDIGEAVHALASTSTGSILAGSIPVGVWAGKDTADTWKELSTFSVADGSDSWTAPWGIPIASAIACHPKDAKTFYVGVEVGGMYRTRDGGKKWFNLGIPHPDVHSIQVSPAKHDRLYVTTGGGSFCSDDEGFTWRRMGQSNKRQYSMGVAAHPAEADRVIISAASGPPPTWKSAAICDIYLSTDAGRRFRTVAKDLKASVQRNALIINPKVPSEVVFGTSKGDLFYSNDGGESFDRVASKLGDIRTLVFA